MLPALVLTAGLGTRLDPLTRLVAKSAVPVAGSTLVERILARLRREGVKDVVLNLHHRPETITAVVGDGAHLGLRVRYSWEQPILGSAGGPRHALPLVDAAEFLIVNGDTLSDFALGPMIDAHRRRQADVTLALVPNPSPRHYNGLVLDADDRITGWSPKGQADGTWHFIGIQVARASVFADLADGVPAETVTGVYLETFRSAPGRIRGFRAPTEFLDVGTPRDYLRTVLRHGPEGADGSVIETGADIDPSSRLVRSVVWSDARIDCDVSLEDCIVAGAIAVPRGVRATGKVLVPASIARPGDHAKTVDGVAIFPLDDRAG